MIVGRGAAVTDQPASKLDLSPGRCRRAMEGRLWKEKEGGEKEEEAFFWAAPKI